MQRTRLICNNFSGINRSSSVFDSSVITATDLQNVELFATETNSGVGIRTSKGNIAISDLLPESEVVVNIFESVQKSKTYFFVHSENENEGKIYLFSPNTGDFVLKVDSLTVTGKSSATDVSQGWSDLWVFSNSSEILSIELENYDEEGNLNEVKIMDLKDTEGRKVQGLGLIVFAGRLWIFDKQILWFSSQENIYDFSTSDAEIKTSAGYIEFVKNITAIYLYLGALAVFHSNSSCMIAQDETDKTFYKTFDSPGGCAGYNSLVFHGTELYFYDDTKKGVFSFLQVINGDKTLGENIAIDIQDELFSINPTNLDKIKALSIVTSDRNEVWLILPSDEENYTTIMIYDYLRKTWVKRKSQKINTVAIVNGVLYSGGSQIYKEYESELFAGEFIEAYYKCSSLNLGVENSIKIFAYPPKITVNTEYNNDFYIEYIRDYNPLTKKTKRIVSKSLKNVLRFDVSHWDLTFFPFNKIQVIKKLPTSYFKSLKMSFFCQEKGQDFCINNIEFGKIKIKS